MIDPLLAKLLERSGTTADQYEAQQKASGGVRLMDPERGVSRSPELVRILSLPRRLWETNSEQLAEQVTAYLRAPGGTQKLRPVQAATLKDAFDQRGAFCPQRVAAGKCCSIHGTEIYDARAGKRRSLAEYGPTRVFSMEKEGRLGEHDSVVFPSGRKPCVELVLRDGSKLVLSTDHPVYTHYGWVEAAKIPADALVAVPRILRVEAAPTIASDDEVTFAAYLLSDGCVSQATASFSNGTPSVRRDFEIVTERVTGRPPFVRAEKSGHTEYNVRNSRPFRTKWGINGLAKEKRLPATFWGLPDRQISLFLNRFWACDGYMQRREFGIVLASEKMIDDLKFLLLRLGVRSRKHYRAAKLNGKVFDAWRLTISNPTDVLRFAAAVGPVLGKEARFDRLLNDHAMKPSRQTNVDVVPVNRETVKSIGRELGWPTTGGCWRKKKASGLNGLSSRFSNALGATTDQWVGRGTFARACADFGYRGQYAWLGHSDLAWERIASITPVGECEVADLTVPDTGNFVCNNIVIHNTLSSLLGFTVLNAQRPLLLVPAKLKEKTMRDMNIARKNWLVPPYVRIVSYEILGRTQSADLLREWSPDVIIADECHRLRNTGAIVTKRVGKFMEENENVIMVALSGTIMKRSIKDYAHIAGWCLKHKSPTPSSYEIRTEWSLAIDDVKDDDNRLTPGALMELCNEQEKAEYPIDPLRTIRRAYRRRLTESPGVIATQEGALSMSLLIEPRIIHCPTISGWSQYMRTKWERPDGVDMMDGMEVWRHLREMACGFFYRWNPPPPKEWREARKLWTARVRQVLRDNRRGLESEGQVINAVDAGQYPNDELVRWRAVKDEYDPEKNKEPVWVSDAAIDSAIKWAHEEKGIVWVEHTAFGERMAAKSGLPFYQNMGLTKIGRKFIEDHPPGEPMIAAREPNFEGRNLQFGWSKMLMTTPHTAGYIWEQTIGRLHRDSQEADEVVVTVAAAIPEMLVFFDRACQDARLISDTTGQEQKLCYADITIPPLEERAALWDAARRDAARRP